MGRKKKKIPIHRDGESFGETNPFAALNAADLPAGSPAKAPQPSPPREKRKPGMRVEIRREKSGRGGKTVTTLTGLTTLDKGSFDQLLKELKTQLGTGGVAIRDGIQLQGDCREKAEAVLTEKGFRPVRAGG